MLDKKLSRLQRIADSGWTQVAPGIYSGKAPRPFIGPQTTEMQSKIDYWNKLFNKARINPDVQIINTKRPS